MRHSHHGRYVSRTPRGNYTYKRKPVHNHSKKDMTYLELRKKFHIRKYADDDGDGVPNYKDCRPWDKKRQDFFDGNIPEFGSEEQQRQTDEDLRRYSEEKARRLNDIRMADKRKVEEAYEDAIADLTAKTARGERYYEDDG